MKNKQFDYEKKVWGVTPVKVSPYFIQGLKLKYALQDLAKIKRGRVLDVGCGAGNMVKAIKCNRPELEVWGCDISRSAIGQANLNTEGVRFKVSQAEHLPFSDGTFDFIMMFDVLEHLEKPEIAIREVRRLLKSRGFFHVFSPLDGQPFTPQWLFYSLGWKIKDKYTGHVQLFSDKSFQYLVEKCGLKTLKRNFSFHFLFSVFDVFYFIFLDLFKFKPRSSIEGMLYRKRSSFFSILSLFYRGVIALGYYESIILRRVPGAGGHYLFKKD